MRYYDSVCIFHAFFGLTFVCRHSAIVTQADACQLAGSSGSKIAFHCWISLKQCKRGPFLAHHPFMNVRVLQLYIENA